VSVNVVRNGKASWAKLVAAARANATLLIIFENSVCD